MICPIPLTDYPHVLLAHGGGGKLMHDLIRKMFVETFDNPLLGQLHDGAVIEADTGKLAFTTDSFVVHPLFFPGGNIGSLAVYGTVNDLAMCGAKPRYLSAGFVLEEGFPMETLWKIIRAMSEAAKEIEVEIVTGDTKVVERGKADGVFINTTGIGSIKHQQAIGPERVSVGDSILLWGDIARHGMAIMAQREGLSFESTIESDAAPLHRPILQLLAEGVEVHCLRDATRGGVATVLNEIAQSRQVECEVDEKVIHVREEVRSACEILGLDPLYVANEGVFVAFVPESAVEQALHLLRRDPAGAKVDVIGRVTDASPGLVTMRNLLGTTRVLQMLSGEQLPRIC